MDATTKSLINRIAGAYNRHRDEADPTAIIVDIQQCLDCSYGRALCFANDIRTGKVRPLCKPCKGRGDRHTKTATYSGQATCPDCGGTGMIR